MKSGYSKNILFSSLCEENSVKLLLYTDYAHCAKTLPPQFNQVAYIMLRFAIHPRTETKHLLTM